MNFDSGKPKWMKGIFLMMILSSRKTVLTLQIEVKVMFPHKGQQLSLEIQTR